MTKFTYPLLLICIISAGLLYYVSKPLEKGDAELVQGRVSDEFKSHIEASYSGNLYTLFKDKGLSDFSKEELMVLLASQDSHLLRELAEKFDAHYTLQPEETVSLLEGLAEGAIAQGLCSNFLLFSSHVNQAQELNQIELSVVGSWLMMDREACYEDYVKSKKEAKQAHRLSLMTAAYVQDPSLDLRELLEWGDTLGEDIGILAQKLSVHSTEESREVVNAYFERHIEQPQVQASLMLLLKKTPEHLADSQMEWLATVDLSQCKFAPQVVGSLFSSIAHNKPQLVVDTLNETDYLEAFLSEEQRESRLADFYYQEFYDNVLFNYIQNIAKYEFENANYALDNIVNPHIRRASEKHIEKLRPYYEQHQKVSRHQEALGNGR